MKQPWFFCLLIIYCVQAYSQPTLTLYVATDGSDRNSGSANQPFKTLDRALQEVVKSASDVRILLKEGVYVVNKTISISDKHTKTKNLSIASVDGQKVIMAGGPMMNRADVKPVSAPDILSRLPNPGSIFEIDLRSFSKNSMGQLRPHGHRKVLPAPMELFVSGKPMTLARWPNNGFLTLDRVDSIRTSEGKEATKIRFASSLSRTWQTQDNVWLKGIFANGFADEDIPATRVDGRKEVQTNFKAKYGIKATGASVTSNFRRFFFYNVLEELDTAGEWYLDRKAAKIYFWPVDKQRPDSIFISTLETPILELDHCEGLSINGITFGYARSMAMYVHGTTNVRVSNCLFTNLGTVAISMNNPFPEGTIDYFNSFLKDRSEDNKNFIVSGCKIFNTGTGGILLTGGNRETLTSGNNIIENCEFANFSRLNWFSCPAVLVNGVGNLVRNCSFHDSPGQAIMYWGNNHTIAFNHFTRVVREIDDQGAVYTGRDPSSTGTTIINNYFSQVTSRANYSVAAVYIDDGSGGIRVKDNVFYNAGSSGNYKLGAVHVNGGKNNMFDNNVFIQCKIAYSMNSWSNERWRAYLSDKVVRRKITEDVDIRSDTYVRRYPFLDGYLSQNSDSPRFNKITNSLAYKVGQFITNEKGLKQENTLLISDTLSNFDHGSLGFDVAGFLRFYLNTNKYPNLHPIDFDNIGLR